MTEPIEKWKEEFTNEEEIEFHKVWDSIFDAGYREAYIIARKCWIAAKRSTPVVELPMPEKTDHTDVAFYVQKVFEALTAAGINYRIKGE